MLSWPMRFCRVSNVVFVVLLTPITVWAQGNEWPAARGKIVAAKLKKHIQVLAGDSFEGREAGSRGGHAAGGYIIKTLTDGKFIAKGDQKSFFQSFGGGYRNILALLPGSHAKLREQVVLIGAHYDHVGYGSRSNSYGPTGYIHNGADDNASGTAALLELALAFSHMKKKPKRSLLFVFWDAEEKGLLGSKYYVANPTIPLSKIKFAFNVDMIGRVRNDDLTVFGTRTNRGLRRLASEANSTEARLRLDFAWHLQANSDHYSFFRNEIPILMLHSGLHGDYHRPSDDAHLINVKGMERATRLMGRLIFEIANASTNTRFRPKSKTESAYAKQLFETPLDPLTPRLGVWWDEPKKHKGNIVLAQIRSGSPADLADLRAGDTIAKCNGKDLKSEDRFQLEILAAPRVLRVSVRREGVKELLQKNIRLPGEPVRIGVAWRFDPAEPGVAYLTRVISGSAASHCGMVVGDRIYRVNGKSFRDGNVLFKRLRGPGPFKVTLERDGRIREVTMKVLK